MNKLLSRTPGKVILTLVGIIVAWAFFWPVVWMTGSAFRPEKEIFEYFQPISIHTLIPSNYTLDNFRAAIEVGFGRAWFNSIVVSLASAALGLAITVPAAFALSVLRFRGRGLAFAILFVTFSVPFELVAIPLASSFRDWGLTNTYTGLILPGLANGFAILLLRQFFAGVPEQLKEAARVDGAGWFRIMLQIYVPLAKPALASAGLMLFIGQWQAYLWPLLVADKPEMQVGSVALANLQAGAVGGTQFGAIFAGAILLSIVPTVIMLSMQRVFVLSIASTGVKG